MKLALALFNMEDKHRASNPWWAFVKQNKQSVAHLPSRKQQFEVLSEMWQSKKDSIVSVPLDYLMELRSQNANLKQDNQHLRTENDRLNERLMFLEEAHQNLFVEIH